MASPAAGSSLRRRRHTAPPRDQAAEVLEDRIVLTPSLGAPQDLTAYYNGAWITGVSSGTAFGTTTWATWANISWNYLGQGDFNDDGRTDVIGLNGGDWWIGLSTGSSYTTLLGVQWTNAAWQDIRIADLNGDGRDDIFARTGGQFWASLSTGAATTPAFTAPTLWATTGGIQYESLFVDDMNGDGGADLVVYDNGDWIVGLSTGTQFGVGVLWARWIDVPYQALGTARMNADGASDIVGFRAGQWFVGISTGAQFVTYNWARWGNVVWNDLRVGDFNGDGIGDLAGRNDGNWWVSRGAISGNTVTVTTTLWASWANIAWQDVRVGDYNGDGRDDIVGRTGGQLWVAVANAGNAGATATTSLWSQQWLPVTYRAVATIQANTVSGGSFSALTAADANDDDPILYFWTQSDKDEEFTRRLLGV